MKLPFLTLRLRAQAGRSPIFTPEAGRFLAWYAAAWAPVAGAYMLIFLVTTQMPFIWVLATAVANISVPALLGLGVGAVMRRWTFKARFRDQIAVHALMALVFATLWHAALIGLLAFIRLVRTGVWNPEPFLGDAFAWQMFQGLTLYFLIVAGFYGLWASRRLARQAEEIEMLRNAVSGQDRTGRLFFRSDGELAPVDTEEIVLIKGADDYCEIHTRSGSRLVRATLASLEARLDPSCFIRVHRSYIVNVRKLANLQSRPDGAMTACMVNGETVPVSRRRAHRLRAMMV